MKSFSWDLVKFDETDLVLHIFFENPDEVSGFRSEDFVIVTFYGVTFFKSLDLGVEVEFGKQLNHRIMRQVSASDAELIDHMESFVNVLLFLAFVPLLLFVGFGGRLLPTWMFLNSLQLFVHLPLLETYLPANLSSMLAYYLGYIRLNNVTFNDGISESDARLRKDTSDSSVPYFSLLKSYGYAH